MATQALSRRHLEPDRVSEMARKGLELLEIECQEDESLYTLLKNHLLLFTCKVFLAKDENLALGTKPKTRLSEDRRS